jgi:TRAP-type C4-dicarboxylate transport system permease small subunit
MPKRNRSAFVCLAMLALMAWGSAIPLAEASTGWAPVGGLNVTPIKIPSAVLLIVFALAALGGLLLLRREPSGPSALQEWFEARRRRDE